MPGIALPRQSPILCSALLLAVTVLAACSRPASSDAPVDARSRQLGSIAAWSEAVGAGVKRLALSSPVSQDEMDGLVDAAEEIAADHGVSVYRESDFLVTDLFPPEITQGKQVLLIYKGATLDRYQELKERKATLMAAGQYGGLAREDIAREFGRLLSYPDSNIDARLVARGHEVLRATRPALSGVWKAPTVSLDDPRWRIEDAACLNGCSLVAYHYFRELLADSENDERPVMDLYNEVRAFNQEYISKLTSPKTAEQMARYDAANDAALDCTPDGDGLQHEITAPPPTEIEQHDERVIIRYEYWNAERIVHLDRDTVPVDVVPSRLGYSIGRYQDGKLIVETSHLLPNQLSLGSGAAGKFIISESARFVEQYAVSEDGERLEIDWSVVDPVNLRAPYIGKVTLLSAPDWELDEFVCEAITGEF